jgi:hypothetical protein
MNFVIIVLALLQIAAGLLVAAASESAIHQILAAVLFGFGVLTLALFKVITTLEWTATKRGGA